MFVNFKSICHWSQKVQFRSFDLKIFNKTVSGSKVCCLIVITLLNTSLSAVSESISCLSELQSNASTQITFQFLVSRTLAPLADE